MVDQVRAATPSSGPDGSDMQSAVDRIAGLMDDQGHIGATDEPSRAHPDYNPDNDPRNNAPDRDERGRFRAQDDAAGDDEVIDGEHIDMSDDDADDVQGDDQTEDTEQLEADDGDTDDDQTDSAVDDAADDDGEDAEQSFDTVADLAEAMEVSEEDLLGLQLSFKAAGEDVTATLADVVAGYQKDADYRRNTGKLADERRKLEAEHASRVQQVESQHMELANALSFTEQVLVSELQTPQMEELRQSDPAEWNARQTEVANRLAYVRDARQKAAAQYQTDINQRQQAFLTEQHTLLREAVPDWGEDKRDAVAKTMESLKYSQEEINSINDHRLLVGALELAALRAEVAELRELKAKAKDTVKRVKKTVPKFQKPGKQKANAGVRARRDTMSKLRNKAKKSGSVQDAAAVIEQYL